MILPKYSYQWMHFRNYFVTKGHLKWIIHTYHWLIYLFILKAASKSILNVISWLSYFGSKSIRPRFCSQHPVGNAFTHLLWFKQKWSREHLAVGRESHAAFVGMLAVNPLSLEVNNQNSPPLLLTRVIWWW